MKKENQQANPNNDKARQKVEKSTTQNQDYLLAKKINQSKARSVADNSQRKKLILIGLLTLLFIALLIIVVYKMPDRSNPVPNDATQAEVKVAELTEVFAIEPGQASYYYPFSDQFMYFSGDKIELLNSSGEVIYDEGISFKRPVAVHNDEYFVAGDRDSNRVLVFNHESRQFSLSLDGTFAGAYFGGNQYLALIEEKLDQPSFVHIVSLKAGKIILTIQFFESGYPIAVSFSNDLDFFDILLANTAISSLRPIINRYDLTGNQLGQIVPDGYPFLYSSIYHDQNNNPVLGSNSGLLATGFSENAKTVDFSSGKIYQLFEADEISALASTRVEGDIVMVDWDPESSQFLERQTKLLDQIDQIAYNQTTLAISRNNRMMLYNLQNDEIILEQIVDSPILRLGFFENTLWLIMEDGVKSLQY